MNASRVARALDCCTHTRVARALQHEHCNTSTATRVAHHELLEHCNTSTATRALQHELLEHCNTSCSSTATRALQHEHCNTSCASRVARALQHLKTTCNRCVQIKWRSLRYARAPLKSDKTFFLAACAISGLVLKYADEPLRSDPELVNSHMCAMTPS